MTPPPIKPDNKPTEPEKKKTQVSLPKIKKADQNPTPHKTRASQKGKGKKEKKVSGAVRRLLRPRGGQPNARNYSDEMGTLQRIAQCCQFPGRVPTVHVTICLTIGTSTSMVTSRATMKKANPGGISHDLWHIAINAGIFMYSVNLHSRRSPIRCRTSGIRSRQKRSGKSLVVISLLPLPYGHGSVCCARFFGVRGLRSHL